MATSSRHSLQTTSTYSAACSIWAVPPRLSIRPPGRFLPARASLWKTPGSGGSPSGPGEGKGPESSLPPTPAHSVHLPSRERRGPGPGQGRPWKGAPPPFSPPAASLTHFLSAPQLGRLTPGVVRRGCARSGERAGRGRAPVPGGPAGGPGPCTPPPGRRGQAGARRPAPSRPAPRTPPGPPPPPAAAARAAPPRRTPEAAGAAPSPPPHPGGGARAAVTSRGARWQHLPAR